MQVWLKESIVINNYFNGDFMQAILKNIEALKKLKTNMFEKDFLLTWEKFELQKFKSIYLN